MTKGILTYTPYAKKKVPIDTYVDLERSPKPCIFSSFHSTSFFLSVPSFPGSALLLCSALLCLVPSLFL